MEAQNTESKALKREFLSIFVLFMIFGISMLLLFLPTFSNAKNADYIAFGILAICYVYAGLPVFRATWHNIKNGVIFDEHFLMFFATFAAICIGEISEAAAVMLFFRLGECLESMAIAHSKRSIKALLQIMPDIAHKQMGDDFIDISPKALQKGDIIRVKVGEKIPADSIVISGKSYLDTRSINGESVPVGIKEGEFAFNGAINTQSLLILRVERVFEDSHLAKLYKLVKEANAKKAHTQKLITRFARIYTPIVCFIALCVGIIPPFFDNEWHKWIYRALVVMMISCPCALVIAVPLGYVVAIGKASAQGILFKGSIYLEQLANIKNIVFDKTGTLTQGIFEVIKVCPVGRFSGSEMLSLAVCAESLSNHPIATCIAKAKQNETNYTLKSYEERSGKGIISLVIAQNKDMQIALGNALLMREYGIEVAQENTLHSIVHIACNGEYMGYILLGDKLKAHIKDVLESLQKLGIEHFGILSGDAKQVVESVAKTLGIVHFYGALLPTQKADALKTLKTKWSGKTAFIGDGVNDALVLRESDVGISMATDFENNDVSKESADIVLTGSNIKLLLYAIKLAKHTKSITWQNIMFALISKAVLIGLGIMGFANMWLAVFGDVGVALLALLNAMRISKYSQVSKNVTIA